MKKFPLVLLMSIFAVVCGGAAFVQTQSNAKLQATVLRLNQTAAEQASELTKLQTEQEKLRTESGSYQTESQELRKLLASKAAPGENAVAAPSEAGFAKAGANGTGAGAGAGSKAEEGGFMSKVAKMYEDPAMRKVMRTQQMAGIKMLYADLGKELGLSPEDASQVMELLADRQMAMSSKSMAMLGGGIDGEKAEELGKSVAASKEEYDQQLKGLLGEGGMKKFTEYESGAGDRMQVQQVQQSLAASGMPLDDRQRQGLLGIMKEERLKTPPNALSNNQDPAAQIKAMQTGEGIEQFIENSKAYNDRVAARARTLLTPDQINSFDATQKQQLDMMRLGVEMMKKK